MNRRFQNEQFWFFLSRDDLMREWSLYGNCKHEKILRHGRGLNRIKICRTCGLIIINNISDLIAYLRKPRIWRNGKVIEKAISRDMQIDFICENADILAYGVKRKIGRPLKTKEAYDKYIENLEDLLRYEEPIPKQKENPLEWPETWDLTKEGNIPWYPSKVGGKVFSSKKMIRDHDWREQYWQCVADTMDKIFKIALEVKIFPLEMCKITAIFDKVLQPLEENELRPACAYFLTKKGKKLKEAMKLTQVGSDNTVRKWAFRCEKILKRIKQYPSLVVGPKLESGLFYPYEVLVQLTRFFAHDYEIEII
jgi:hypothetical protein